MKLCRCPVCHSQIHLDALIQDAAGSELLGLLAGLGSPLARPLVAYLGLFRPAKSDLSNARALRLAQEALAFGDRDALAAALTETVRAIREKRQNGTIKPLSNHNYLTSVLASVDPGKRAPEPGTARVTTRVQGREETQEQANAAWEAQLRKYGVDPEQYKTGKERRG